MYRFSRLLSLLFLLPLLSLAQTSPEDEVTIERTDTTTEAPLDQGVPTTPPTEVEETEPASSLMGEGVVMPQGATECFTDSRYRFGSVSADPEVEVSDVMAGTPVSFIVTMENQNPYPITDAAVYVKIFKIRTDEDARHQNGDDLVDQFFAKEGMALREHATSTFTFEWNAPTQLPSGNYRLVTYVTTSHRYNLLGLSFTDDITGNQTEFTVHGIEEGVQWDKDTVEVDHTLYRFAAFTPKLSATSTIRVAPEIINPTDTAQAVTITWKLYYWDAQRQEHLIDTKEEGIMLEPHQTLRPTYEVTDTAHPVYLLVADLLWRDSHSLLNIRFVRDGIDAPRINFPSIGTYPLVKGTPVELFSCLHNSGTSPTVPGHTLTLTLKDDLGTVLHTYNYQGDITGDMMAVAGAYTPETDLTSFSLTATLSKDGNTIDETTTTYDCSQLNAPCPVRETGVPTNERTTLFSTPLVTGISLALLVLFLTIIGLVIAKRRNTPQPPTSTGSKPIIPGALVLFLLLGGMMVMPRGVEAEGAVPQFNKSYNGTLYYHWTWPVGTIPDGVKGIPIPSLPKIAKYYFAGGRTYAGFKTKNPTLAPISTTNWDEIINFIPDIPVAARNTEKKLSSILTTLATVVVNYNNHYSGYNTALSSPNMTVKYFADVKTSTGLPIHTNATVPVGTVLHFTPKPFENIDISWFGTGYSLDSPYGHWSPNSAVRNTTGCDPDYYVNSTVITSIANFTISPPVILPTYIPLEVTRPVVTVTHTGSTAGLACNATKTICTVTSPGKVTAQFSFAPTVGRFYYGYLDTRPGMHFGCFANADELVIDNSPLINYALSVPAKAITFTFTAVANNTPPTPPTITEVGGNSHLTGTAQNFNFVATDPNNDTIRYGIDWNRNGTVDQWVPGAGYVPSGTVRSAPRTFPAPAGAKIFQALTQDSKGALSAWRSYTITLTSPAAATVSLTANPTTVTVGNTTDLTWSSTNAVNGCTATGAWSGAKTPAGGTQTSGALSLGAKTFSLTCYNSTWAPVTVSRVVTVTATPPPPPPPPPPVPVPTPGLLPQ